MKHYRLPGLLVLLFAIIGLFAITSSPAGYRVASPPASPPEQIGTLPDDAQPGQPEQPTPELPEGKEIVRLLVPSLEIDAPIVTLGVDAAGTMQSPDNPFDVAWYSFSALPGEVSNVVMSGHFDYINHGPAVFFRLTDAQAGNEVQLVLVDGTIARYSVRDVAIYDEATAPVQEIVGPTDREVLTLITCGGAFDPLSREYDKRVVLRAERISETAQGQ